LYPGTKNTKEIKLGFILPRRGAGGDSFLSSSEALRFWETLEVPREYLIPRRDTRTTPHEVGNTFGMNPL